MGNFASRVNVSASTKMANLEAVKKFVTEAVTQDKVVIFSKSHCPYCKLAKDVFSKVKQPIKVYELDERDDERDIQDGLLQLNGFRTVPQVYINGKCIGGGTDVLNLYESGKLEPMLIG